MVILKRGPVSVSKVELVGLSIEGHVEPTIGVFDEVVSGGQGHRGSEYEAWVHLLRFKFKL